MDQTGIIYKYTGKVLSIVMSTLNLNQIEYEFIELEISIGLSEDSVVDNQRQLKVQDCLNSTCWESFFFPQKSG